MRAGRFQAWQFQMRRTQLRRPAPVDLVGERAALVADDDAGNRLKQIAILNRHVLGGAHKNATRPINHMRLYSRGDQAHDLFLQHLPIAAAIFVPDHQVDDQALESPVGVRLYQLAHQIDIFGGADL